MPILRVGPPPGHERTHMFHNRFRFALVLGALAAAFVMIAADVADARSRISAGSRGTRTYSAPPSTTTAPTAADGAHHDAADRPGHQSRDPSGAAEFAGRRPDKSSRLHGRPVRRPARRRPDRLAARWRLDRRSRRACLVPRARLADRHCRADRLAVVHLVAAPQPARDRDGTVDARHAVRAAVV